MTGARRGRTGRGWDAAPSRRRDSGRAAPDQGTPDQGMPDQGMPDQGMPDQGTPDQDGAEPAPDSSEPRRSAGRWGSRSGSGTGARSRTRTGGGDDGPPPKPVDPAEKAREICLRLLSFRPRTRAELATALRGRGIDDEVAQEVLDRYGEVGMIDDRAFAQAWVTSRHHGRGLARRALAGELRRKGVDSEAVGEALDGLDSDTEAATARALVDRKLRGVGTRDTPEVLFRRLTGMLARKGYPAGLVVRVVKDALRDRASGLDDLESVDLDQLETEALDAEALAAAEGPDHASPEPGRADR